MILYFKLQIPNHAAFRYGTLTLLGMTCLAEECEELDAMKVLLETARTIKLHTIRYNPMCCCFIVCVFLLQFCSFKTWF